VFSAILCNSKVIEINGDKIRISHGFEGCQPLTIMAKKCNSPLRTGIDDMTDFKWQFII